MLGSINSDNKVIVCVVITGVLVCGCCHSCLYGMSPGPKAWEGGKAI